MRDAQDRLVTTTQELLWERGYVGTSPRAIQQRAGVGQGSMYHHFAGKADLALAAVRRSAAELKDAAAAALSIEGTAVDRIRSYLMCEREVLRGCRIGRLTQDPEIIADPQLKVPVRETFEWLRAQLAGVLVEGSRRGEFATDFDPDDVAATIAAVLQGGYVLARAEGDAQPFHHAVAGVLQLLEATTKTNRRGRAHSRAPA